MPVWIRRSWLKCRPVGKGNVDDFAPEDEIFLQSISCCLRGILFLRNTVDEGKMKEDGCACERDHAYI